MISEIRWIKILRGKETKNMVKISYLFFAFSNLKLKEKISVKTYNEIWKKEIQKLLI